jgi:hypothetical protein
MAAKKPAKVKLINTDVVKGTPEQATERELKARGLDNIEAVGADSSGAASLEANRPLSRTTAFATAYTADDIPDLTDKVAETRKAAEAARQAEIRAKMKVDTHINRMKKIQSGEIQPAWQIPDSSAIRVMNAKISLGRFRRSTSPTADERVEDARTGVIAAKRADLAYKAGSFAPAPSHAEVADALNADERKAESQRQREASKGLREQMRGLRLKNPKHPDLPGLRLKLKATVAASKNPQPKTVHTEDSVENALVMRAAVHGGGVATSSDIGDNLRANLKAVSSRRTSLAMEHLVAKSQLEEASGQLESIQEEAQTARQAAEDRAPKPDVDAATGLEYGSKNTITRGKSRTDPAVETVGEDLRNTKQISLTNADYADLSRSIAPLRSAIEQGGGNVRFPTHTRSKDGVVTEIPSSKKTPISGGAIDAHLESVRTSHSGAVRVGPETNLALGHIRDAHETLLTLKALVPQGSVINTPQGEVDFHKTLNTAISKHKSAHQAILRRVVKRNKAIKSNLPDLKATRARVAGVSQTLKGGRKVYDISESTGSAVTGKAGQDLARIAGIGGTQADETGNLAPEARASVIEYNRTRAPEQGDRTTSPQERQIKTDIAAYSKVGRTVPPSERRAVEGKDFTKMADEDVAVEAPFSGRARAELSNRIFKTPAKKSRTTPFKEGNGTA